LSKSILLISRYFAPQNAIGAVRPTKLAKYLTRMGYHVTVLCAAPTDAARDPLLAADAALLADVREVRERSFLRWWKERGTRKSGAEAAPSAAAIPPAAPVSAKKNPALDALYRWLSDRSDAAFARDCAKALRSLPGHYDIVWSCYGPASVHTVACLAKKRGLATRWVADFRDEASVPFRFQKRRLSRFLRSVRNNADLVTSVSRGALEMMGLEQIGKVLPNGYDSEDAAALEPYPLDAETFNLAYCGQLYSGRSDLTPVFHALQALVQKGACEPARIRIHYAGRQGPAFRAQAVAFGLADRVADHGLLTRKQSLALQKSADVLLAAAWNTPERHGVVTGKLLEYMLADKPVLCVVSGELPDSEAYALTERLRLGAAYEQARETRDAPKLEAYLRALYDARFSGTPSPFHPDRAEIAEFDYPSIAKRFAQLLESL